MKRRDFLSLSLVLAGCGGGGGGGGSSDPIPAAQAGEPAAAVPLLAEQGVFVQDGPETAVIVFNGEVLAISFDREWATFGATGLTVRRWGTGQILAQHPWPGAMGCAIVKDGAIHIFGNTNWQNPGNKVIHSVLAADFMPSAPVDALLMNAPAAPFKFYNTSVAADANGYRMVVETTAGIFFARSVDLNAWTFYGGQLMAGQYCGCPSIHYLGGVHWLTYLAHMGNGRFETRVARSADDCFTFTYGKALLTPDASDGLNCSDVDMVEFGGKVCGVYLDGDQTTYANLKRWGYDGTLAQMFAAYQ